MPRNDERPHCFGILENVFPWGDHGFRTTPESCSPCIYKTECLRTAMQGKEGLKVKEESVDRAYSAGMISFVDRWSRKKTLHKQAKRQDDKA